MEEDDTAVTSSDVDHSLVLLPDKLLLETRLNSLLCVFRC